MELYLKKLMNKYFLFIFLFIFISCQNKNRAIDYNNMIIEDQKIFYQLNDSLFFLLEDDAKENECINIYDSLKNYLKFIQIKYDTIENFNGDNILLYAMKDFIHEYQRFMFNEYLSLLNITTKPKHLIMSKDLIIIDSLYNIIKIKQDYIHKNFNEKQQQFLENHEINN